MDTIFAVSSGRPPAAIAVIRVSGSRSLSATRSLAGSLPPPRKVGLRSLRGADGLLLDRALVLVFPGPLTATGEDLVELHCHGGRAVVSALEAALAALPGLRPAEAGEFTRRALVNGRLDLTEAEGLADLLEAETEGQRVAALAAAEGRVSQQIHAWMDAVATLSARVEAAIDFADEDDVAADEAAVAAIATDVEALAAAIAAALNAPPVERLHDGLRVVIAGPPNSGKSTLLNLLSQREAAIVSSIPGTTRDRIEASLTRGGIAYVLTDTAGLVEETDDPIEAIGISRATAAVGTADILLWVSDAAPPRPDAIWIHGRSDMPDREILPIGRHVAVAQSDVGSVDALWLLIGAAATRLLPRGDALPLRARHRELCCDAARMLQNIPADTILMAEHLRRASSSLAMVVGINATEAMLTTLFARFCIGK